MASLQAPLLLERQRITDDWTMLPSFLPVPGMGVLAVNSFVLKGAEPLLVDTGLVLLGDEWLDALGEAVALDDLRWIWLSHMDADHIGNLARVLACAPHARVVTTFLGMGKMNLMGLDVSRVHTLAPGERLDIGDRTLVATRPPYYDAPETLGLFDPLARVLFVADSFGALLPEVVPAVEALAPRTLQEGLREWSRIDAPWLAMVEPAAFADSIADVARFAPQWLASSHLPPVDGDTARRLAAIITEAYAPAAALAA